MGGMTKTRALHLTAECIAEHNPTYDCIGVSKCPKTGRISLQYRSFATRVAQLKIWHYLVIGIGRNVCRCTFNRYSVITQFAKLAAGEQLCRLPLIENYRTSKPSNVSPEKSQILSCDTVVANERYEAPTSHP